MLRTSAPLPPSTNYIKAASRDHVARRRQNTSFSKSLIATNPAGLLQLDNPHLQQDFATGYAWQVMFIRLALH